MKEKNIPFKKFNISFLKVKILFLSLFSLYNKAKFCFSLFISISVSVKALIPKGIEVKIKL